MLLLAGNGGWGGFGGGYGGNQLGYDFPWLLNGQNNINANTNNGFRDAMINDGITSIRDGIGNLSTQLCNGFASVEQGASARQMANMQSIFGVQSALQQCLKKISNKAKEIFCFTKKETVGTLVA